MKIFMDDLRPAPIGYVRTYTVKETIDKIMDAEHEIGLAYRNYFVDKEELLYAKEFFDFYTITEISCDNDLGEGQAEGYKLLDWLEATGRNYPIRIHTDNAVARARMLATAERNHWEVIQ